MSFLLRLPVITQNFLNSFLIKLKLLLKLVDPYYFVNDLRKVTHLVECFVVLAFVKQLYFEFVDIFPHLGEQLRLVLGDSTSDLRSHKKLVVH